MKPLLDTSLLRNPDLILVATACLNVKLPMFLHEVREHQVIWIKRKIGPPRYFSPLDDANDALFLLDMATSDGGPQIITLANEFVGVENISVDHDNILVDRMATIRRCIVEAVANM